MLNRVVFCLFAMTLMVGSSLGAGAEERFALVIGNSKYQTVAKLDNPARDAEAVSGLLRSAGFDVTAALDLGQTDMRRTVRDFAAKLATKGKDTIALIYFAGHGLQIDGQNYLLPVDAKITKQSDVALEAVRLADIMNLLSTIPSNTRIVILDACRNNPFDQIRDKTGRGLAIVNAPAGTLVAYSTSPGAVADDGWTNNSPFAEALIKAASEPGAVIGTVLQNVRLHVHKATKGLQTPWEVTALTKQFQFFEGAAPQPKLDKSEDDWRDDLWSRSPRQAYDIVVQENNVIVYKIFLNLYPQSVWSDRVRVIMERRLEMLAWYDAVTLNSIAAFEAFLNRYPNSDLALAAKRLIERVHQRNALARTSPGALPVGSNLLEPVIKEVRVPVTREVIREVRVPVTREIIREVRVPVVKEVIKTVRVPVVTIKKVPVVKIKTVIKKVRVPVVKVKTVIKRVPVVKVKTVVKRIRVPVVKIRTVVRRVRVPCRCTRRGGQTVLH